MEQGLLIVLSGFSGAGKGTIINKLLEQYDKYALSISATTRKPREGEVHAREYFFVSTEEFLAMIENDELIEHAKYVDNYYGTPRAYVEEKLQKGIDVILEIEVQGAVKIKEKFPEAVLIFVSTKDAKILEDRLKSRNTEKANQIEDRLLRAAKEAEFIKQYDYILINESIEEVTKDFNSIIESEHKKTFRNKELIEFIKNSLKNRS